MITLGIETSGRSGSIALVVDGVLQSERELSATGRRHARTLVPEIGALLSAAERSPSAVDVVAVSIGPGSFTGLRVGCVCAKTFAYAAGCRIVAVDTFLAVAAAAPADVSRLWVIDDALRGDLFAGEYVRVKQQWLCPREPRLISIPEWSRLVLPGVPVSGPGVDKLSAELEELGGIQFIAAPLRNPRAGQVALLGETHAVRGMFEDHWTLEPRYIRRSAAEEKADARPE